MGSKLNSLGLNKEPKDTTVVVAMSGGVDSSTVAGIMKNGTKYSSSLVPLINNKQITEKEIFLHTMPFEKESASDNIGIRTSKYKYFRNSKSTKKDVHLYDLENDPYENNDISKSNLPIIEKMEKLLH